MLDRRDQVRAGLSGGPPLGLPPGFQIRVPQYCLTIPRRQIERRPRRHLLTLDDIPQMPPSARPWVWKDRFGLIRGEIAGIATQLIGVDELRRSEARAGRFREHAGD